LRRAAGGGAPRIATPDRDARGSERPQAHRESPQGPRRPARTGAAGRARLAVRGTLGCGAGVADRLRGCAAEAETKGRIAGSLQNRPYRTLGRPCSDGNPTGLGRALRPRSSSSGVEL
jgi:hypothetical protein